MQGTAADRIRYLEAEVTKLRSAVEWQKVVIAARDAEIAKLRAALEAWREAYFKIQGAADPYHSSTIREAVELELVARRLTTEALGEGK